MKYVIANDIHGSYYYANIIKEAFILHHADKLLLLGDLLYHGPRNDLPKDYNPKLVIPLLNGLKDKIIAIRGNCDSEVDQMVLEFPCLADYTILYDQGRQIFLTHGHIYHPNHMPLLQENDIFIFGHIHIPVVKQQDGIHILNAGSISIPKENTHHSYAVLENYTFTLYDETHHIIEEYTL